MGGDGRFVNHSCEPNCEMQKWSVLGLPRMALFASRDIKPGEELTYDYNFALFNPSEGQQCRCGSSACRGVIGTSMKIELFYARNVAYCCIFNYNNGLCGRWKKSKGGQKHFNLTVTSGIHGTKIGGQAAEKYSKIKRSTIGQLEEHLQISQSGRSDFNAQHATIETNVLPTAMLRARASLLLAEESGEGAAIENGIGAAGSSAEWKDEDQ